VRRAAGPRVRVGAVVFSARPELGASWALFQNRPWGYGAGVKPRFEDLWVAKQGMAALGYDPENGYVENFMFGGRIELHSGLMDMWAAASIPGGLLLLLIAGMALAAMILGIAAVLTGFLVFGALLGIAAIILGALSLKKTKEVGAGKAFALTGIITGAVSVLISICMLFVYISFFQTAEKCLEVGTEDGHGNVVCQIGDNPNNRMTVSARH